MNKIIFDRNREVHSVSSNQRIDINENFQTHDIDKQQKFSQFNTMPKDNNSREESKSYKNKEDARFSNSQKRVNFKPPDTYRSDGDPYQDILTTEPISLLEKSQEIIEFQDETKKGSLRQDSSSATPVHNDEAITLSKNDKFIAKPHLEANITLEEAFKASSGTSQIIILNRDRKESIGPQKDTFSNSIEKKDVEDEGQLYQDTVQDDENGSQSSGDLFNNKYDQYLSEVDSGSC